MATVSKILKCIAIVAAIAFTAGSSASLQARRDSAASTANLQARPELPQRIISLVPATTEMLFVMGAGGRIAGVSDYDRFPPEVEKLPKVGGLLDPNVERLISLKPDLAIVYDTQTDLKQQLDRAHIPIFRYAHRGLPDITQTLRALGERIGNKAAADSAAARIEAQLDAVRARVAGRPKLTTLLVFGRDPGALRHIDASGGIGFLHDVLELAGGTDVLSDLKQQSVDVSTEMVLRRAPQVILELHYGESLTAARLEDERKVWSALPSVPAVRNNQVHLLLGNEYVVPGPRIAIAAQRIAETLHPEAFGR